MQLSILYLQILLLKNSPCRYKYKELCTLYKTIMLQANITSLGCFHENRKCFVPVGLFAKIEPKYLSYLLVRIQRRYSSPEKKCEMSRLYMFSPSCKKMRLKNTGRTQFHSQPCFYGKGFLLIQRC